MKKTIFIYYTENKSSSRSSFYRKLGPGIFEASSVDNIIFIAEALDPDLIVLDPQEYDMPYQKIEKAILEYKIPAQVYYLIRKN